MKRFNPDRDFDEFDCEMLDIEYLDYDIDYDGDDYDAGFEEEDDEQSPSDW